LVYDRFDKDYMNDEYIYRGEGIKIEYPDEFDIIKKWLKGLSERCIKLIEAWLYKGEEDWTVIAEELNYANAATASNQRYKCFEKLKAIYKTKDRFDLGDE